MENKEQNQYVYTLIKLYIVTVFTHCLTSAGDFDFVVTNNKSDKVFKFVVV